jgi:hypothetical protein
LNRPAEESRPGDGESEKHDVSPVSKETIELVERVKNIQKRYWSFEKI